jgi:hypothetical protein
MLEEAMRMREFPGIEYRDTLVGRQAFLLGTRLGLWQIVQVARAYGGSAAKTSVHLGIAPQEVTLALAYERAYPAEIAAVIADLIAANERLAAIIELGIREPSANC